jgi:inorganic pyrophosphatase
MYYPFNYGFIPHTLSEDGDPVDAAVIGQVPVTPGVVIRSRPIGVLIMEDEAGPSWRCRRNRAAPSDRLHLRTIKAVLKGRADEIVQLTKTTSCAEAPHQLEPPLPFAAA